MKKVLMISFHFPPVIGSGKLRTLKFAKYLKEYNWQPYVLTVRDGVYKVKDESVVKDIPKSVEVFRTVSFDNKKYLSIRGKSLDIFSIPDAYVSWLPFGVIKGIRLVVEKKIDVLYSTSPVPTAHLIALILKKITKLPWLADFRDPWIEFDPKPSGYLSRIHSALEKMVIVNANKVVAATEWLKRELMRRYPDVDSAKFCVVSNGFDEDDFDIPFVTQKKSPGSFEMIHSGLVNDSYRNPEALLRAIKSLIEEGKLPEKEVTVRFLGTENYLRSRKFKDIMSTLGLEAIVVINGYVPYKECIQCLFQADVLVLLQGGKDTMALVPAKAFEYLRVGKPILALTLEGATANLIRECNAGIVANPENVEEIKKALWEIFEMTRRNKVMIESRQGIVRRFSRKELTKQLADIFDQEIRLSARNG